jgi:hypothetical protein
VRSSINSKKSRKSQPNQSDGSNHKVKFAAKSLDEDDFEDSADNLFNKQAWEDLEQEAVDQLDATDAKSDRAYFFLGIALFKMKYYDQSIKAF